MTNLKYYCFLLIISICTFTFIKVRSYDLPLRNKTIYLDPGHGGIDCGAKYKDILEKNINLEISYLLLAALENKGANVYMTRYDDYDLSSNGVTFRKRSDLSNRAKMINDSKADLYLSLHLNSSTSSKWSGAQIFYDDVNKDNYLLAQSLQDAMKNEREISEISTKYMYKRVNVPGVLIELGFLSNSKDRAKLLDPKEQNKIVNTIVNGVLKYYQ